MLSFMQACIGSYFTLQAKHSGYATSITITSATRLVDSSLLVDKPHLLTLSLFTNITGRGQSNPEK